MTPCFLVEGRTVCCLLAISMMVVFWGCATIPRHYERMAEPDITLTELNAHPERYRGKVVLLGGAIIGEEEDERHLWLRVKNRPLDEDHRPHLPVDKDGPEAGSYWVIVVKQKPPPNYRHWARMTVLGRVMGIRRFKSEPVLSLIYVRGWGMSTAHDGVWAHSDPNYDPSTPASLEGEVGGGPP